MTDYKINRGLFFPFTIIFVLLLLASVASIVLFKYTYAIIILPIIMLGIAFSSDSLQINSKTEKYRYSALVIGFIPLGKWKDLNKNLKYVSILKSKITNQVYGGRTNQFTNSSEIYYEIYLISEDLQDKMLITGYKEYDKAYEEALKVAEKSKFKYIEYNKLF